eukprot:5692929-Amphidinium_carterae.1
MLLSSKNTRSTEAYVRPLVGQLFSMIAALHENGISHRDVKPENILVSRDMNQLNLVSLSYERNPPQPRSRWVDQPLVEVAELGLG